MVAVVSAAEAAVVVASAEAADFQAEDVATRLIGAAEVSAEAASLAVGRPEGGR